MPTSALRLYAAHRATMRVSTCFHMLLLHMVFCISSTSLRNMTGLVFLPNRGWFVVYMGAQNITHTTHSASNAGDAISSTHQHH